MPGVVEMRPTIGIIDPVDRPVLDSPGRSTNPSSGRRTDLYFGSSGRSAYSGPAYSRSVAANVPHALHAGVIRGRQDGREVRHLLADGDDLYESFVARRRE